MEKTVYIQSLLVDIEQHLRHLHCWDQQAPSAEALASTLPFAADSLEFCQWLQWVFIPRIHSLLAQRNLPSMVCGIAPMAQEWVKIRGIQAYDLIKTLEAMDAALSQ